MHPLTGFTLKLHRAEHHLETLRHEIERFIQSDFYETVTDRDYNGRFVARLKNVKQPSPELGVLIGDCVHNLRSSLDYLAYGLAEAHTQPFPKSYAKSSAFPIFRSGRLYRRKGPPGALHKMRGMSRSTRAAIQRLQPYHRKDPPLWTLWMLEELASIDKHRLLHVTTATVGGTSFQLSGTGVFRLEAIEPLFRPMKENVIVGRFYGEFGAQSTVEVHSNIVPDILFDKSGSARSVRGLPVLEVLHAIRDVIVLRVVTELGPELKRLFPQGQLVMRVGPPKPDHRRPEQRGWA